MKKKSEDLRVTYEIEKANYPKIERNHLNMGNPGPKGKEITVNSLYFEKGGEPFIGVMGEYHFSRDKKENWKKEIAKMKAGGVNIVASYVFWIYHEEIEGNLSFEGDLDLRSFVKECKNAGLYFLLRLGPWAHGECRNGGFPDWLINKPFKLRENNPEYLALVKKWYEGIYREVKDLLYKDGGPIIGVQLENELVTDADHLLTLKKMAQEIGFDVPLYTVTGWNSAYGAKIPVNDTVPVFAAYAEAPWEQHTEKLPLSNHYLFNPMRNDAAVGLDIIGKVDDEGWRLPYEKYPFATCELGAGLPFSHHRRPVISGMDAYALSLVKLGSGNNLVGYYMYHGGTNKIGKLSTFQESRKTGYPNDYAILNYDFHTAITQYGEVREQYRLLNLLHLFVKDFGDKLAPMVLSQSKEKPEANDKKTLRYAIRSKDDSGFLFINHYQRLLKLEENKDVTVNVGPVTFPSFNVSGEVSFIFPYNFTFKDLTLEYATAQLLCKSEDALFFAEIPGIKAKYKVKDGEELMGAPETILGINDCKIVTLSFDEARFLRKIDEKIYIGENADIYVEDGVVKSIEEESFSYKEWNGKGFIEKKVNVATNKATAKIYPVNEPFKPKYPEELSYDGERKLTWKKLEVSSDEGFIELDEEFDVAEIYADKEMVADAFYCGEKWRVPASLLYKKECYIVMSELKDDFYREF
ncbi:MAG: beta-galactosidase [Lachnospiraceae bacterium]|nr:beta-galactosidase [Lachnospiraceae bacterium]